VVGLKLNVSCCIKIPADLNNFLSLEWSANSNALRLTVAQLYVATQLPAIDGIRYYSVLLYGSVNLQVVIIEISSYSIPFIFLTHNQSSIPLFHKLIVCLAP